MSKQKAWIVGIVVAGIGIWAGLQAETAVYRLGAMGKTQEEAFGQVVAYVSEGRAVFALEQVAAVSVQLVVSDARGEVVFDSGPQAGTAVAWDYTGFSAGTLHYSLQAWDGWNISLGGQTGQIEISETGEEAAIVALATDVAGDFTIGGSLGVGTDAPQRAVHLVGPNAVFRMDRPMDTAAFLLVRTDPEGNPWKTFVVGANASGPNNGEFIINDIGQSVGGSGQRRMTIQNNGDTIFTGNVTADEFFQTSALRYKQNVQTVVDPMGKLSQLRGVEFEWKETGRASLGLIAEEVAEVLPEMVSWEADGKQLSGVNYGGLVGLLVEASKAQQKEIEAIRTEIDELEAEVRIELERARKAELN